MSVSKVHISKFSGTIAKDLLNILGKRVQENTLDVFCGKIVGALGRGFCNNYTIIWDNYSVGGDQIEFIYNELSECSRYSGKLSCVSWRVAFGYNFDLCNSRKVPKGVIHRRIFSNIFNSDPSGSGDLVICIEEVLGPTIQDFDLEKMQERVISELLTRNTR